MKTVFSSHQWTIYTYARKYTKNIIIANFNYIIIIYNSLDVNSMLQPQYKHHETVSMQTSRYSLDTHIKDHI